MVVNMNDKPTRAGEYIPPAFPSTFHNGWGEPEKGMALRDYFASKIFSKVYEEHCNGAFRNGFEDEWRDDCAKEAYLMADAMLKARQA
jgi:hypothetical protein